jgi:hypothetical protein
MVQHRHTMMTKSAPKAAAFDRSMPICSTTLSVAVWMPAVSKSVIGTPLTATRASTISLVVPGWAVTIARSLRLHAFSKLDLPTLGRPMIATCTATVRTTHAVGAHKSAHLNTGRKQATAASSLQDVCHLALQLGGSAPRSLAAWIATTRVVIETHRSAMRSWSSEGSSSSKSSLFDKDGLSTNSNPALWHAPSLKLRDEINACSAHGIHRFA